MDTSSNLLLLSTVAGTLSPEPPKKRIFPANPRCFKPGHSSWRKESIQRHTCWTCFKERAAELFANPNLTRWDVSCILAREFRNYYCCCCILEVDPKGDFESINLSKYCRRGHSRICKQRLCLGHNQKLTVCRACADPRAGTSFCACRKRRTTKCNCILTLGDQPQDPQIVELKETYALDMLKRAKDMQSA